MGDYSTLARLADDERGALDQPEPAPIALCGHINERLTRLLAPFGVQVLPCDRVAGHTWGHVHLTERA